MSPTLRIAVQIEKDRAHGRSLLKGIGGFALSHADWQLEQVEPRRLTDPAYFAAFDGLIVRVMDSITANALARSNKPVVDTYGRIDSNPLPSIRLDDEAIARMAAQYLAEHRFTNVAYCGFCGLRFSDARGATFADCAREANWRCSLYSDNGKARLNDIFFQHEHTDRIADSSTLRKWIKNLPKPVAIFCCNDLRSYHVMRICEEAGVDVPQDVAVLGVDNDALLCSFTRPSLSSIETDSESLGRKAAEMLANEMCKRKHNPFCVLHPPVRVVERASTEIYPFKTPWLSDAFVFMHRHLGEGVSSADVVKHLGYSHVYVNRVFNAEVGRSIHQEIIRLRLAKACRLLKETDRTAASIAAECGYPSAQYFSHSFSVALKVPPETWRRNAITH